MSNLFPVYAYLRSFIEFMELDVLYFEILLSLSIYLW